MSIVMKEGVNFVDLNDISNYNKKEKKIHFLMCEIRKGKPFLKKNGKKNQFLLLMGQQWTPLSRKVNSMSLELSSERLY